MCQVRFRERAGRWVACSLIASICMLCCALASAADWQNRQVIEIQSNHWDLDCFFFRLQGVAEADPAKPGNEWFAVSRSAIGSKDTYALIISAKLSGSPVRVLTTGAVACGYAQATVVWMQ